MQIRRRLLLRDTVHIEGGLPALQPVTRAAACAVILNPLAGRAQDDLSELLPIGEELGRLLAEEARAALPRPAVGYGKAAIVGTSGEIEHAAALLHPKFGAPVRKAVGKGDDIIPSTKKLGGPGSVIVMPVTNKNRIWNFDDMDAAEITIADAPHADEVVVALVLAVGGRPLHRIQPVK
jgi:hypothetical protein